MSIKNGTDITGLQIRVPRFDSGRGLHYPHSVSITYAEFQAETPNGAGKPGGQAFYRVSESLAETPAHCRFAARRVKPVR